VIHLAAKLGMTLTGIWCFS